MGRRRTFLYAAVSSALKPMCFMATVAKGFVLGCAATAEIERVDLAFRVFFSRRVQDFSAAGDFVRAVL